MLDLTQLMFESSLWLVVGILFYYILSSAKVFLLVKVQPQLFHSHSEAPKLNIGILFPQYLNQFIKDKLLHRYTLNYLTNRGGKSTWQLVGNKRIDFYYNFLNAITIMLKPFMAIAIMWAILKFLIFNHIAYDELQITLGQIQVKVAYLKSIRFIDTIDKYKVLLFLSILIICGILGLIKRFETKINNSKSAIYSGFTILSILAGLTFFGSDIASAKNKTSTKLRELELEVKKIHENIYENVAEAVVYEDLAQAITEDVQNNERECIRLDSLFNKAFEVITRTEIKSELSGKFNEQKEKYRKSITLEVQPERTPKSGNIKDKFTFSDYMEGYFRSNQASTPTSENYWSNRNAWNKESGLAFLTASAELKSHQYFSAEANGQIDVIVKNIVDYIGEEIFNIAAKFLGIETWELPKAIASFLAIEKCKECFVPKIANVIRNLAITSKAISGLKSSFCFMKKGNSDERITAIREQHDRQYNVDFIKAKMDQQIANANEKAETLIREKVADIVGDYIAKSSYEYDEFVERITMQYKREIGIENLSEYRYDKLMRITQLSDVVLRNVVVAARIETHPFPESECPICAFLFGARLLQ